MKMAGTQEVARRVQQFDAAGKRVRRSSGQKSAEVGVERGRDAAAADNVGAEQLSGGQ